MRYFFSYLALIIGVVFVIDASAAQTKWFCEKSSRNQHPRAEVTVPSGYKIIGGGARVDWSGAGNLLTASYPESTRKWVAMAKDHERVSPATITVCAIGIYDPINNWDVQVWSNTSSVKSHPTAVARIDFNYSLTGGGARVNWSGHGNLLTASFPSDEKTWEVRGKDHGTTSPASITAYAIGIRHQNSGAPFIKIFSRHGSQTNHPKASVVLPSGYVLTGGGALNHWGGAGNLLTASFPDKNQTSAGWVAMGKDHRYQSPSSITVFAIGMR